MTRNRRKRGSKRKEEEELRAPGVVKASERVSAERERRKRSEKRGKFGTLADVRIRSARMALRFLSRSHEKSDSVARATRYRFLLSLAFSDAGVRPTRSFPRACSRRRSRSNFISRRPR